MIMNHEFLSRQEIPTGSSDRAFGLVFSGLFLLLAILSYFSKLPVSLNPAYPYQCPFLSSHPEWAVHVLTFLLAAVSLVFLSFALMFPKALAPLNWLWTKFGLLLHGIVSPVVLGVLFFVIFTPIGVLMRLFGGDPLRLRFDSKAQSYWIERSPPGPTPDSLKEQF
jgi:hypothetical protein